MYRCEDTAPASTGTDGLFLNIFQPYLPMNCEFLTNGVSFHRDFFLEYTIDYGLSSRSSGSTSLSIFFAWHLLPAEEDMFGLIKQFSHISPRDLAEVGLI